MWNPFSYISPSSSSNILDKQAQKQFVSETNNNYIQQKYLIEEYQNYHQKIKDFKILIYQRVHTEEQNARLVKIFSQLISSLEQFLKMIDELKKQYQNNLSKIQNYDHIKKKLQNHSYIVSNIQKDHQNQIDNLLEKYRQKQTTHQINLLAVHKEMENKKIEVDLLEKTILQLKSQNERIQNQNKSVIEKNKNLEMEVQSLQGKLHLLMHENETDKVLNFPVLNKEHLSLQNILISKKDLCIKLINYLSLQDILNLSLTNKKIKNKIKKQLPQNIFCFMSKQLKKQKQNLKAQSIYYNRLMFDQFDNQNVKINAIKYLFFKNKPGTYILSMFQQQISKLDIQNSSTLTTTTNPNTQSALAQQNIQLDQPESIKKQQTTKYTSNQLIKTQIKKSWKDYFKSSDKNIKKQDQSQSETVKTLSTSSLNASSNTSHTSQKFILSDLKNSQKFKTIQNQLSKSFHKHFFSLKLPTDLNLFGKIMEQQFTQLKKQLSDLPNASNQYGLQEWSSKLVILSKFLYLQSQQMWSLCQNIFTKLIEFQKTNIDLKSQIQDKNENNKGLRKLVDQLAKSKIQMQKRIWQSQRKQTFLRSSMELMVKNNQQFQKQIYQTKLELQKEEILNDEQSKQLIELKDKYDSLHKKYKSKMTEFTELKEQLSKIQWI